MDVKLSPAPPASAATRAASAAAPHPRSPGRPVMCSMGVCEFAHKSHVHRATLQALDIGAMHWQIEDSSHLSLQERSEITDQKDQRHISCRFQEQCGLLYRQRSAPYYCAADVGSVSTARPTFFGTHLWRLVRSTTNLGLGLGGAGRPASFALRLLRHRRRLSLQVWPNRLIGIC